MTTTDKYRVRAVDSSMFSVSWTKRGIAMFIIELFSSLIPEKAIRAIARVKKSNMEVNHVQGSVVETLEEIPKNEQALVSMLMSSYRAAKKAQKAVASPYQPGAFWKSLLEKEWKTPSTAISNNDLETFSGFLRNFFRNEGLSGFWGEDQMFEIFSNLDGIENKYRATLLNQQFEVWRDDHPKASIDRLEAPKIGNPWGYVIEGVLIYEPAFEYHHQADYFASILADTNAPVILEIGGGFGGLAFHILQQIPKAKYIGFDLPENILIQSYYLSCAYPQLRILCYDEEHTSVTQELLGQYDVILMPNFVLPKTESAIADVAINIRSLSEMPLETIEEYCAHMDRLSRKFIFHENIYKARTDGLHGIPTLEFPSFDNHALVSEQASIWPRYDKASSYPCKSYLFVHKSRLI